MILSHNPTFKQGENINAALDKVQGKYIKILHDDDVLTPNCLQYLFEAGEETGADLIFAHARQVHEDKSDYWMPVVVDMSLDALLSKNFIMGLPHYIELVCLKRLGVLMNRCGLAKNGSFIYVVFPEVINCTTSLK